MRWRRLISGIGDATGYDEIADFYAKTSRFATAQVAPFRVRSAEAIHQQVDNGKDKRQPHQTWCRDCARELRDVIRYRKNKSSRALAEDQVDQHDREDADEPELDEVPQKLCRVGHVFSHGRT